MTTWQYTTAQFVTSGLCSEQGAESLENALNHLGAGGWEAVSSAVYRSPESGFDVLLITLKRPVRLPPRLHALGNTTHTPTTTTDTRRPIPHVR